MTFSADDRKRFLTALGVTPQTVGLDIYTTLKDEPTLPDIFEEVVRDKLTLLGFDESRVDDVAFPLSDPALKRAMHHLVEAHRKGVEHEAKKLVQGWLPAFRSSCGDAPLDTAGMLIELKENYAGEFDLFLKFARRMTAQTPTGHLDEAHRDHFVQAAAESWLSADYIANQLHLTAQKKAPLQALKAVAGASDISQEAQAAGAADDEDMPFCGARSGFLRVAPALMAALGVTKHSVGCEQLYDSLRQHPKLQQGIESMLHQQMMYLGYDVPRMKLTYRDPELVAAMVELIGGATASHRAETETDFLHYLSNLAARLPTPDAPFDEEAIITDLISERVGEFDQLMDHVAHQRPQPREGSTPRQQKNHADQLSASRMLRAAETIARKCKVSRDDGIQIPAVPVVERMRKRALEHPAPAMLQ